LKRYRSPRDVLAEIDGMIASSGAAPVKPSVLDQAAEILLNSRHYEWVGVYLSTGERASKPTLEPAAEAVKVPIRIGRRVLGVIAVTSGREFGLAKDDRMLLERVAKSLAMYLAVKGKHLIRRARENQPVIEEHGRPPVSEKSGSNSPRAAAAGETRTK
jgi:hypothetical protein